ncbi:MAG: nucleotide exchange factor GrpE [Solirubrobacteraceae bacterium]|nr:nucleotide exchange factor GrpE [Solirubrobacteraceae bacterium]
MTSEPEHAATDVERLTGALEAAELRAGELAFVARKQTEMADELHAENRRLREGEVREAVAPLVRGLARLADEVAHMRGGSAPTDDDLGHIEQRLSELLHDAGVTILRTNPGDAFDVHVHVAAGSVPTEDPLEDQTIVGVRRPGLIRDDGRLVRPAEVLVYRFDTRSIPGAPSDGAAAPEPGEPE